MNIIYYNPDEMRADVLGCYGHTLNVTPNIDKFAEKSVRFEQCHVQNPVCSPSRCSFMTGSYVHNHGHRSLWHLLQEKEDNTLKYLKDNSYDVHVFGKNDVLSANAEIASVTKVHEVDGGAKPINAFDFDDDRYYSFLYKPLEGHHKDYYQVQEAIKVIKNHKKEDAPYMLFLPLLLPHCPYTVPEPWYSMINPDDVPDLLPIKNEEVMPSFIKKIRETRRLDKISDKDFRKIMAVYLGMVAYADHLFGLLLDALESSGEMDNTSIFFFSDHGDWAGDYGLVEKWPNAMDDIITRVPMIINTPQSKAGHVVKEQIECFDIMQTTLNLTGIQARHSHFSQSLIPMLQGENGDPNRKVFCEGGYDAHDQIASEGFTGYPGRKGHKDLPALSKKANIYSPKVTLQKTHPQTTCRSVMIRSLTHKLVMRSNDVNELYDLKNDPHELTNLYNNEIHQTTQHALEQELLQWYLKTSDTLPWDRDERLWTYQVQK